MALCRAGRLTEAIGNDLALGLWGAEHLSSNPASATDQL